jgi:hypothetical protein
MALYLISYVITKTVSGTSHKCFLFDLANSLFTTILAFIVSAHLMASLSDIKSNGSILETLTNLTKTLVGTEAAKNAPPAPTSFTLSGDIARVSFAASSSSFCNFACFFLEQVRRF